LRVDPHQPRWAQRDRFILSKGHACVAVYAALATRGFFPEQELLGYGRDRSRLMNHVSHHVPGVEFSTGSLGHGLPFAVGKALAARRLRATWRTVVLLSDGELDEGSNWEAMMFAAHHRLANVLAVVDYNKLQSLTTVAATLGLEPLVAKIEAFGWTAIEVDGHDHDALRRAFDAAAAGAGRPTMIVAHTTKGKGVSYMENAVAWHYRSPSLQQLQEALAELGGEDA
jgi:transketolase